MTLMKWFDYPVIIEASLRAVPPRYRGWSRLQCVKDPTRFYAPHSLRDVWGCRTHACARRCVSVCLVGRMTTHTCDYQADRHPAAGGMLSANVSGAKHAANGSKTSGCGSVSVGFPITMMVTGMVGNTLALILAYISYRKKENKRKRSFLLCIGSLALTDLFGQLLTSPIVISVYRADLKWERIDSSGFLCAFFGVCMTTFGLCALFLASAMAIERALAVTNPHWYSNHMKTSVTKQTLAVVWLLVLLFALLPIIGVGKYTRQWPGTWCFISTGDGEVLGNVFATTFAALGIFSLCVTVSCNVLTIRGLIVRCKTKSGTSLSSKQWERLTTETVVQLLGIMCVLLICWSPLLVCFFFFYQTTQAHTRTQTRSPPAIRGNLFSLVLFGDLLSMLWGHALSVTYLMVAPGLWIEGPAVIGRPLRTWWFSWTPLGLESVIFLKCFSATMLTKKGSKQNKYCEVLKVLWLLWIISSDLHRRVKSTDFPLIFHDECVEFSHE